MEWKFTKENPLKVFTTFSGYDSQCLALRDIGIPYDLVGWSEIDTYAIRAHNAIFPEFKDRNYGDITKIDWAQVPDFDLLTYSSPCQDFSNAGLQRGGQEGSGTRSSLLWEVKKAILAKHPGFLLMENVKALVSDKFLPTFRLWLDWLAGQGYTNFCEVLNAKDYGIPQNRERIFVVSFLENTWYHFPQKVPLKLRLKDMLEDKVDEKYYLDQEKVDKFVAELDDDKKKLLETD
jgi:DNA (cytosine-5)-methyltransferase 1